jgi:hypothetical protein
MSVYQEYIADLGNNLYQGSWHSTKSEILDHFEVDSILHIGFDPDAFEEHRTYKKLSLDDNPQSANNLMAELPGILLWISRELATTSILDSTRNKRVLVCCSAGRSRSVAIVMAFLTIKRGMTCQQALEFIQGYRPMANPNAGFLKLLAFWEKA